MSQILWKFYHLLRQQAQDDKQAFHNKIFASAYWVAVFFKVISTWTSAVRKLNTYWHFSRLRPSFWKGPFILDQKSNLPSWKFVLVKLKLTNHAQQTFTLIVILTLSYRCLIHIANWKDLHPIVCFLLWILQRMSCLLTHFFKENER